MPLPARSDITRRLETTLGSMVAGTFGPVSDAPAEVKSHLDALLSKRQYTVRDGILVLLALEVEHGEVIDWRLQELYNPARAASRDLEDIYARLHIAGSREALQTGVKGVTRYIDRKNTTWKAVLQWTSCLVWNAPREFVHEHVAAHFGVPVEMLAGVYEGREHRFQTSPRHPKQLGTDERVTVARTILVAGYDSLEQGVQSDEGKQGHALLEAAGRKYARASIEAAFLYLAAGVAATARNLPAMPELDTPKLTFGATFGLLDSLLQTPSGGAHEQFIFAALLDAYLLGQLDEDDVVETKNINASDASSGTAADVQHRQRGQVQSAYEVTANDWRTKVAQAVATMETHELRRVAILGRNVVSATGDQVAAELPADLDVTVLDLREEVRSLVARLDKQWRREALKRLYSHLVDKQSDDARVRDYVDVLRARGLTAK